MSLKSLAKQTIIYGVSTILLRMGSWMLAPYYTHVISKESIGVSSSLLSIIAFLNILYMLGMETSYFRFAHIENKETVFKKTLSIVFFNSLIWSAILILSAKLIVEFLGYPGKEIYVYLFTLTLFFENLCNIPFARLRQDNKAIQFIVFKAIFIFLNIGLNLLFFSILKTQTFQLPFHISSDPVELIFLCNLIPWILIFLYFLPKFIPSISWRETMRSREILQYSWPMLIVGTAGMVNEVIDRPMLTYLLPGSMSENAAQVGVYSSNYKLSIIMTLIIQAFRMGAEPYFFKISREKDAKKLYAIIMDFFVIVCSIVFVLTSLNRNLIAKINESSYAQGVDILPILLLANLFLGMYYNTAIWYKATNNTFKGAYISIVGAIITITLNWYLIPHLGYFGSAWATLICYFIMLMISFIWGRSYFPIPYNYGFLFAWISLSFLYTVLVYTFFKMDAIVIFCASLAYLIFASIYGFLRFKDNQHYLK